MFKKFQKRFRVVAYNNVCYKDYKFVSETMNFMNCENWITRNAKHNTYVYDILDIKLNKFDIDYTGLFRDYERIKQIINNKSNKYIHRDQIIKTIFLFKELWTKKRSFNVAKKYFEELHILVNNTFPLNY